MNFNAGILIAIDRVIPHDDPSRGKCQVNPVSPARAGGGPAFKKPVLVDFVIGNHNPGDGNGPLSRHDNSTDLRLGENVVVVNFVLSDLEVRNRAWVNLD